MWNTEKENDRIELVVEHFEHGKDSLCTLPIVSLEVIFRSLSD